MLQFVHSISFTFSLTFTYYFCCIALRNPIFILRNSALQHTQVSLLLSLNYCPDILIPPSISFYTADLCCTTHLLCGCYHTLLKTLPFKFQIISNIQSVYSVVHQEAQNTAPFVHVCFQLSLYS